MSEFHIWFPGPLPGLNELIAAAKSSRGNRNGYARLKDKWTYHLAQIIRECGIPKMKAVGLSFTFVERDRRRDQDNVSAGAKKLILDALVKSGVIADDGWDEIRSWGADTFDVDRRSPGVRVTIVETMVE